nr:hypothetical protein [Geobacillus thermocatenulatus]
MLFVSAQRSYNLGDKGYISQKLQKKLYEEHRVACQLVSAVHGFNALRYQLIRNASLQCRNENMHTSQRDCRKGKVPLAWGPSPLSLRDQINWWPDSTVASAIAYPSQTVKKSFTAENGSFYYAEAYTQANATSIYGEAKVTVN